MNLERTVGDCNTSVSNDDCVLYILLGHITARVCTIFVVLRNSKGSDRYVYYIQRGVQR